MEISWLGHSCVRVRSNNATLITDPYQESLGLSMGLQTADVVTISHAHPHHSHQDGIEGDPKVLRGPGEYEIGSFYITGVGTDRGEQEGEPRLNTIFAIKVEGVTLGHLGDLNRMLAPQQIEWLGQTDVLFVPAGGVCTLDTSRVADLLNLVGPKIVVPLHYRTAGVRAEIQPLGPFLDDMGVTEPDLRSKLEVTATSLPRDLTLVVLERVT